MFHATYGHYSGRYNEAQIGATATSAIPTRPSASTPGRPARAANFAPGFDPANYDDLFGQFPTANVFFENGLSSPITKEFTVSGGFSVGATAYARGELRLAAARRNLIEDFIDQTNGFTDVVKNGIDYGTFTNIVYRNTDDAPSATTRGSVFQGRFTHARTGTANGDWTIQLKNEGNYEGESAQPAGHPRDRRLSGSVRRGQRTSRSAACRTSSVTGCGCGRSTNSTMETRTATSRSGAVEDRVGQVYSLVATSVPLTSTQEALLSAYPDAPPDQELFFDNRGSETFPGYAVIDFSVNYRIPAFRSLRPWLKLDVFNPFNNLKQIGFDTTVQPDFNGPLDALGLPLNYIRDDTFGQARSTGDFPRSLGDPGGRSFRMSFGVRF